MRTAPARLEEFSVSRVLGLNINTGVLFVRNTWGGGEVYVYEESQFSVCVNVSMYTVFLLISICLEECRSGRRRGSVMIVLFLMSES